VHTVLLPVLPILYFYHNALPFSLNVSMKGKTAWQMTQNIIKMLLGATFILM